MTTMPAPETTKVDDLYTEAMLAQQRLPRTKLSQLGARLGAMLEPHANLRQVCDLRDMYRDNLLVCDCMNYYAGLKSVPPHLLQDDGYAYISPAVMDYDGPKLTPLQGKNLLACVLHDVGLEFGERTATSKIGVLGFLNYEKSYVTVENGRIRLTFALKPA